MTGSRSRSRSPIRAPPQDSIVLDSGSDDDDIPPFCDCRKFRMKNIPNHWTHYEAKQFIIDKVDSSEVAKSVKYVKILKNKAETKNFAIVEFFSPSLCIKAYRYLKRLNEKREGRTIFFEWERKESNKPIMQPRNKQVNFKPTKPQVSNDTYGFSRNIFESHGIEPPILNKIFVANLDKQVTEAKLREVFSYAGQVVDIFMITKEKNSVTKVMAKIEFDHPMEAVQAISMFNNRDLYGRRMLIQMDNSPLLVGKPLPSGLDSIGPGLGEDGAPLRCMRHMIELQQLRDYFDQEITKLKMQMMVNTVPVGQTIAPMAPLSVNTALNQQLTALSGVQNVPLLQGMVHSNVGQDFNSLAALQVQMAPGISTLSGNVEGQRDWNTQSQFYTKYETDNGSGRSQSYDSGNRSCEDNQNFQSNRDRKMMTTDMLIFTNLPPTVTLNALKNKMREVGEVKFAEITEDGKAIVRFFNDEDADRCIKLFDRSKVDGQTIEVRYF